MKTKLLCITAGACVALLAAAPARAAEEAAPHPETQQAKMARCSHESKGLKGDERHKFMSECLKGHPESAAQPKEAKNAHAAAEESSPHRMKACNDEAGRRELHGDERRAFMSSCLKG